MSSWKPQAPAPAEAACVLSSPVGNLTPGQQRWEAGLPEVQGLETPAGAFAGGVPESRVLWPLASMFHSGAAAATLRGGKQALVRWVRPLGPGPGQLPRCTHRRHGSEALGRDPHRRRPGHCSHTPLPQQPRQPRGGWAWEAPSAPQSPQYTGRGGRRLDDPVAGGAPGEPRVDSSIPDCSGHAPHVPQIWTTSSTHAPCSTHATDMGHMLYVFHTRHRHGCTRAQQKGGKNHEAQDSSQDVGEESLIQTQVPEDTAAGRCMYMDWHAHMQVHRPVPACTQHTHEQGWQHTDVTGLVHTHVIEL